MKLFQRKTSDGSEIIINLYSFWKKGTSKFDLFSLDWMNYKSTIGTADNTIKTYIYYTITIFNFMLHYSYENNLDLFIEDEDSSDEDSKEKRETNNG